MIKKEDNIFNGYFNSLLEENKFYTFKTHQKRHINISDFEQTTTLTSILNRFKNDYLSDDDDIIGILINYYENGDNYCPLHRDFIMKKVYILSFGDSRIIEFVDDENIYKSYVMNDGDILCFDHEFNSKYKHRVLKSSDFNNKRISIAIFI